MWGDDTHVFDSHFSNSYQHWSSFHLCGLSVYLLWRNVCVGLLPIRLTEPVDSFTESHAVYFQGFYQKLKIVETSYGTLQLPFSHLQKYERSWIIVSASLGKLHSIIWPWFFSLHRLTQVSLCMIISYNYDYKWHSLKSLKLSLHHME